MAGDPCCSWDRCLGFKLIIDPVAGEQIAALPDHALQPLTDLFALLETAPGMETRTTPRTQGRTCSRTRSENVVSPPMWSWTGSTRSTLFASNGHRCAPVSRPFSQRSAGSRGKLRSLDRHMPRSAFPLRRGLAAHRTRYLTASELADAPNSSCSASSAADSLPESLTNRPGVHA